MFRFHTVSVRRVIFCSVVGALVGMSGCGGGGDSADPVPVEVVLQGTFIDSPVSGARHVSNSRSGTTDPNGVFTYLEGEIVSFYIGDVLLGSAAGAEIVTPIDFVEGASDETDSEDEHTSSDDSDRSVVLLLIYFVGRA